MFFVNKKIFYRKKKKQKDKILNQLIFDTFKTKK